MWAAGIVLPVTGEVIRYKHEDKIIIITDFKFEFDLTFALRFIYQQIK